MTKLEELEAKLKDAEQLIEFHGDDLMTYLHGIQDRLMAKLKEWFDHKCKRCGRGQDKVKFSITRRLNRQQEFVSYLNLYCNTCRRFKYDPRKQTCALPPNTTIKDLAKGALRLSVRDRISNYFKIHYKQILITPIGSIETKS